MNIQITEAIESDRDWVRQLMCSALDNYYSGDHGAHADRIFNAHINGGQDSIGFFSYEQKMFVAKSDGLSIGLVHLVGKKQTTYKISPLIVDSNYRHKAGIGKMLLKHAISYAKNMKARQIYCTVAEQNLAAFRFFISNGFVRAGNSNSHYKEGIVDHMLYMPVNNEDELLRLDRNHVSVRPLSEINRDIRPEISKLLLENLPNSFQGVDESWVGSLFDGYDRRKDKNVNSKYKLLFVATNSSGSLLGVVGATPKKGNPINLSFIVFATMKKTYKFLPYSLHAY
jgi:ribosomal protein S18 acetylase RimI-like enzyme